MEATHLPRQVRPSSERMRGTVLRPGRPRHSLLLEGNRTPMYRVCVENQYGITRSTDINERRLNPYLEMSTKCRSPLQQLFATLRLLAGAKIGHRGRNRSRTDEHWAPCKYHVLPV